jgi:hypothetical protein
VSTRKLTREIILQPAGIITQPNKLGVYPPGALSRADYAYIRNPGMLEAANAWVTRSASLGGSIVLFYVIPVGQNVIVLYLSAAVWRYQWIDLSTGTAQGDAALQDLLGQSCYVSPLGRLSSTHVRSRTIVNMLRGTLTWDYESPSGSPQTKPRTTGILAPGVALALITSALGGVGALAANTACHITLVQRRTYADGYQLVSAPATAQFVGNNTAGFENIQWQAQFSSANSAVGDVIEVYRTRAQAFSGTTGTNTGSNYFLSSTYTLTSTDITNATTPVLTDTTPDVSLGQALYTNAGEGTAAAAALVPPTCKIIATFKTYTFYINRTEGSGFRFRIPVYWGDLGSGASGTASFRSGGIGARIVTGNTTIGSPTIASVSAADMVGIVVGQTISARLLSDIPSGSRVVSITASSITFNANATAGTVGATMLLVDMMEIDGLALDMSGPFNLAQITSGFFSSSYQLILLDRVYPPTGAGVNPVQTIPASDVVVRRGTLSGFSAQPTTVRATNGANYVPSLPKLELNETARTYAEREVLNGVQWSEENQPENCPPLNTTFCGSGEVYAAESTRDALWMFASDGLWRLSGTGGSAGAGFDWRIDPVDSTLSLAGPLASCTLRDTVYAYTNRGLVSIDSSGTVKEISQGRLNDQLPGPPWSAPTYSASNALYLVADQTNDEIWMREPIAAGGRVWLYNTLTDAFTNDIPSTSTTHGDYSSYLQTVLICDAAAHALIAPTSTSRNAMDVAYQPVYATNPFELRHWHRLDVAAESSVSNAITASVNSGVALGTRTAVPGGDSIHSRTSFSITRNAPAVANNIAVRLQFSAASVQTKLQGVVLNYVDITDQRKSR